MGNLILSLLKKTYKILIVLVLAIIFFLGYNIYLIDHSLVNLKITLNKVNNAKTLEEVKKLASALDYSLLTEISSQKLQSGSIAKIELAKDILSNSQDTSRLQDVKFALQEVIKQREKERPAVLVVLDKVASVVTTGIKNISKPKLEDQARSLKERIETLRGKDELQTAYYELGNIYTQLSDFSKAKDAYEKAIALNPESNLAKKSQFNLSWDEKQQGNLDEAIKGFEKLAESSGEERFLNFSKYQIAEIYRKKGDYEKAIAVYQEIASKGGDREIAQLSNFQVANTFLYDLKEPDKAREAFEKTKALFKGSNIAAYIEEMMVPHIVSWYCAEGFRLLQEGYKFSYTEKYKEADSYFDKAIEINPRHADSFTGKAICFLYSKNLDKALEFARKAVELSPYDETASVNLGYIYIEMGMINKAIIECKRFIAVDPKSYYSYYNLGCAYVTQNRIQEAIPLFLQVTKINPQFVFAHNNQGWCLWYTGKYGEALEAFERAVQIDPKFVDALFNLGVTYEAIGRYRDAKEKFIAVLEVDPHNTEALAQLREVERIMLDKNK